MPDNLYEIFMLATDTKPDAPSILANGLWIKYRMCSDWGRRVLDNTMTALCQLSTTAQDCERTRADIYGDFLWHIDQHLPSGLDEHVLQWLMASVDSMEHYNPEQWTTISDILLYLVTHGAVKSTTVLLGLVYPIWRNVAFISDAKQSMLTQASFEAASKLCRALLTDEILDSTNIYDSHRLTTRRCDVYHKSHFCVLISHIPFLVLISCNKSLPDLTREDSKKIIQVLCEQIQFSVATYSDLNIIREAFDQHFNISDEVYENVWQNMFFGLRSVLRETTNGTIFLSSFPHTDNTDTT
jgi:mediator of RNA polymerase II transcription subunit 12, fungi type